MVENTEGMTGADIAALVNAAAMSAIKEHISKKAGKLKLSMRHFEAALNKISRGGSKPGTKDLQGLPVSESSTQMRTST
jgi:SpoVK/Ycf46/Vps4 family AAA+-type ATPase